MMKLEDERMTKMHCRTLLCGFLVALALLIPLRLRTARAIAPTLIIQCQTIDTPGFYEIETAIVTSTVGPCIDITGSGVTLSIEGGGLTGDGSHGTGIRIEHGAIGTVIQGWLQAGGPPVNSFNIGVEDDEGGSVISGFEASHNATTGILLSHADGDTIMDVTAANNGHDGIHIMQTTGARLDSNIYADNNGTYGLWLDGAANTLLDRVEASGNGTTNLEISTLGATASNANLVYNANLHDAPNGVVIEQGSGNNRVTRTGAYKGAHAKVADGSDANPLCGSNVWFNNKFTKRKPTSCIH